MSKFLFVLAFLNFFVNISAQAQPPGIEDLDDDLLGLIFSHVTKLKDNRSLTLMNRRFNRIANDSKVFEYIEFQPHESKAYTDYQEKMKENSGAFQVLPDESIFSILTYLIPGGGGKYGLNRYPEELYSLSRTCRFFKGRTQNPRLWTNVKFDIDAFKVNPRMFPVRYIRLLLNKNSYIGSQEIMNAIKKLPCSLSELDLQFFSVEDPDRKNLYLSVLHTLPNLEVLHLGNTAGCPEDIIDSDLAHISKCSNLKVLHLTSLDKITPEGLRLLIPLASLERLELYFMKITENDVVNSLPGLQEWNINGKIFLRHEKRTRKKLRVK